QLITTILPKKIKVIKSSKIIYIKLPEEQYGIPLNIEIFKEKTNTSNIANNYDSYHRQLKPYYPIK
ncbi:hypothetical protein, partial [Dolichospermum sp. LEGE 00246]|uniref:hypothetical protein n=1 Tax=Dolichospermum sp. LEGE 00246 TaxID=1828605 RepID=UPI001D15C7AF